MGDKTFLPDEYKYKMKGKTMKKILIAVLLLGGLLVPGFLHAGKGANGKNPKILIAYYSWSGNTKAMAQAIQKVAGGTLFEIRCVKPYPAEFKACIAASRKDIKTGTPIKAFPDVSKYDMIFVGSPNWFGTITPPVRTFLARKELAGKKIFPFFTHGTGGIQNCEKDVKILCKKSTGGKALAFPGKEVKKVAPAVEKWIRKDLKLKTL